jgi:hypothetical protein
VRLLIDGHDFDAVIPLERGARPRHLILTEPELVAGAEGPH